MTETFLYMTLIVLWKRWIRLFADDLLIYISNNIFYKTGAFIICIKIHRCKMFRPFPFSFFFYGKSINVVYKCTKAQLLIWIVNSRISFYVDKVKYGDVSMTLVKKRTGLVVFNFNSLLQ